MGGNKSKTEPEPEPDIEIIDPYKKKNFALSVNSYEDFITCEKDLKIYHDRHVVETLKVRQVQREELRAALKEMKEEEKQLEEQIANSKLGNNHTPLELGEQRVKNILLSQGMQDDHTIFEKADDLAKINRVEMLKKEIEGTKTHITELRHEIDMLKEDVEDFEEICDNENKILFLLFEGKYMSHEEDKLEEELDYLMEKKKINDLVNFQWRQAQVMVEYACTQIGTAKDLWREVMKQPPNTLKEKYALTEQARNNLLAAGQNLLGAHKYLPKLEFPYCTPEEVRVLIQATTYVFTEMQAPPNRQVHILNCCVAAHQRCGALLQWFDETINTLILERACKLRDQTKKVKQALRRERAIHICRCIKEKFNEVVEMPDWEIDFENNTCGFEAEMEVEEMRHLEETGQLHKFRGPYVYLDYTTTENAPPPLSPEELAPLLELDELFGPGLRELKTKSAEQRMNKKNHEKGELGDRRHLPKPDEEEMVEEIDEKDQKKNDKDKKKDDNKNEKKSKEKDGKDKHNNKQQAKGKENQKNKHNEVLEIEDLEETEYEINAKKKY